MSRQSPQVPDVEVTDLEDALPSALPLASRLREWGRLAVGNTARKGVVSLADQSIVSGTNFFTRVIVGRVCGPADLGNFALGMSLAIFVVCVQQSLISTPYTIHTSRLHGKARARCAGAALVQHFLLAALSILVLFAGNTALVVGVGTADLTLVIWMSIAALPFLLLREFARRVAFAHLHMKSALAIDAAASSLQMIGIISLVAVAALSSAAAFVVIGIASGVAGVGWVIGSRRQFSVRLRQLPVHWQRNWNLGKWMFLSHIAMMLQSGGIILWILKFAHGTTAAGVFAACLTIPLIANPFVLAVGQLLTPKVAQAFAHGGVDGLCRAIRRWSALLAITMIVFCGLVLLFGGTLLRFLYGDRFAGQEPVIWVLSVSTLLSAVGMPVGSGLWTLQKSAADFRVTLISLVITLLAVLALVQVWELMGVACGLAAGRLVGLVARWVSFTRMLRLARANEGLS